jgi:lactoylglutathione lyase
VIEGVSKVVVEVEDQARALEFWTGRLGFELHEDSTYFDGRWVEVTAPDKRLILVLSPRRDERPRPSDRLPTSHVFFRCDDLAETYDELRSRGVEFPQPPVELSFGWWSIFQDQEGNRFALHPGERCGTFFEASRHRDVSPGARMTERLARASSRRLWLVVGLWLLVILTVVVLVATFLAFDGEAEVTSTTESKQAERILDEGFPQEAATGQALSEVVVVPAKEEP